MKKIQFNTIYTAAQRPAGAVRAAYVAPELESLELATATVICQSMGSITEPLTEDDFNWS